MLQLMRTEKNVKSSRFRSCVAAVKRLENIPVFRNPLILNRSSADLWLSTNVKVGPIKCIMKRSEESSKFIYIYRFFLCNQTYLLFDDRAIRFLFFFSNKKSFVEVHAVFSHSYLFTIDMIIFARINRFWKLNSMKKSVTVTEKQDSCWQNGSP